jgi:phosphate transport system permease protein
MAWFLPPEKFTSRVCPMDIKRSFTGHARRRRTSRMVRVSEVLSRCLITVGGIGTIVAIALVGVFLLWVAYPLFLHTSVEPSGHFSLARQGVRPLRTGVDEYQVLGWELFADGTLQVFRLDNGKLLEQRSLFSGESLTCCSTPSRTEEIAFGFADGTVRLGRIGFATSFPKSSEVPQGLHDLPPGEIAEFQGGLASRTPEGQLRVQKMNVELEEPIRPTEPAAVVLIDLSMRTSGTVVSLLTGDGKLRTTAVSKRVDYLTGETVKELTRGELALPQQVGRGQPKFLLLSGVGDNVYLVWEDGYLIRVSTQELEDLKVVERVNLLDKAEGSSLTALQFMVGKTTLLVGDSEGRIRAWFRTKPANAATSDGAVLTAAHQLAGPKVPVTFLAASARSRNLAAGYADGRVRLFCLTSESFLAEVWTERGQPIQALAVAPKDDGLLAETATGVWRWQVNLRHPEVTWRSLLFPVWYEGYEKPEHAWQSSSGSDEFEPKFGLWPLVFGTFKGTFYSVLMGVPLALLAAVYTSEFLHGRARAVVKPTIEMMASLPSVVLGFLAALVLAPFLEDVVPAMLACFLTVPGAFLIGAYLWQLLPPKLSLNWERRRFLFLCAVLPMGLGGAVVLGPCIERLLFHGDFKGWLNGQFGTGTNGWLVLLLPLTGLGTAWLLAEVVNPRVRRLTATWARWHAGLMEMLKLMTGAVLAVFLAWMLGVVLSRMGLDPRASFMGTYIQRNSLIVGFMMGFAIIPIIYTIAEDALSAVPEHLRSASLGCGATPWQTAQRIILPTAMSGLFSAVMIGVGRAVGETMIVLMAAGNTPFLEMNMFNGFRTLSANIATELSEAPENSSHYRVLFLASLTLFAMTFVLNTVAEVIRQRFRRRAYQL